MVVMAEVMVVLTRVLKVVQKVLLVHIIQATTEVQQGLKVVLTLFLIAQVTVGLTDLVQ